MNLSNEQLNECSEHVQYEIDNFCYLFHGLPYYNIYMTKGSRFQVGVLMHYVMLIFCILEIY